MMTWKGAAIFGLAILVLVLVAILGGCGKSVPTRTVDEPWRLRYAAEVYYWKMAEFPGCNTTRRR